MELGWISLWRELLDKPIWKQSTPEQKTVLITILLMANHEASEWEWNCKKFKVMPGEFVTSLESIRKKAGPGISIKNVRTAIARFEKLNFLAYKAAKTGRVISIINWERYQSSDGKGWQSKRQRGGKGVATNNNDNNFKYKVKVPIPKDIFLTDRMKAYVKKQGCNNSNHAEYLFESFSNYQIKKNNKWADWTRAFYDWVLHDKKLYNADKYIEMEVKGR